MKMTKLTTLLLTATLGLCQPWRGVMLNLTRKSVMAGELGGKCRSGVAPDARQNVAPNDVKIITTSAITAILTAARCSIQTVQP